MKLPNPLKSMLGALALLVSVDVYAASYDPDLVWRTLETEHFNITFHQGEEQLADELADTVEEVFDILTVDMMHVPARKTEVVLVDWTDVANGYAMTLPYNTIVIYVTAPQEGSGLALYEDWLQAIFTHEYAHILHLDNVEGLPLVGRKIIGRIVSTNQLSPWWVVEGSATYWETVHTVGGRGRNPASDMILRMAMLEGTFPTLGQMDGFQAGPPGGNTRYLFGQSFLQHIADTTSDDAVARWNETYGGWVLPYLLPSKQVFGQTFPQLYNGWTAALQERFAAQQYAVEHSDMPATAPRLLMSGRDLPVDEDRKFWEKPTGSFDGSCTGAVFNNAGDQLVFACGSRVDGANIFVADGNGDTIEVEVAGKSAKNFTWRPDDGAFVYSATHVVDTYNLYEDVYFHTMGAKADTRLTSGKRARDPEFSPDGKDLIVVRNKAQNNNLARMTIDQSLEPLTEYTDHTQLSTPRFSPDGRFIAVSKWKEGNRDLWIYTPDGVPYRRVTADMWNDRDPEWSADGRTLYFASDRSGISNIYAIDLETERLYQVTNVLSGAGQPSVRADEAVLAWQHYTANGYRPAMAPIDRSAWADRGTLPRSLSYSGSLAATIPGAAPPQAPVAQRSSPPRPAVAEVAGYEPEPGQGPDRVLLPSSIGDQPAGEIGADDRAKTDKELEEADVDYPFRHPVRDYQARDTLFPPTYVLPTVYSTSFGLMGLLSTTGVDTLRRYSWSGYATYRTDANALGGGASFTLNTMEPVYGIGMSTSVVPYGDIYVGSETQDGANIPTTETTYERYWDRRLRTYLAMSKRIKERQAVSLRLGTTNRAPKDKLTADMDRSFLPSRGRFTTVSGAWSYSRGKSYAYSISPEDARALVLRSEVTLPWAAAYTGAAPDVPLLGSYTLDNDDQPEPFSRLQVSAEIREFWSTPWADNHVVAARAAGGVSFGDTLRYGSFRLGGNFGESRWYNLPAEWESLRGYPVATVSGDSYYLGSLEYRAPLLRLDYGYNTVPAFLRTLHGAVFTDIGDAFDLNDTVGPPLVGVGAELRLGMILGWGIGLNARLGYGVALTESGGFGPTDLGAFYFRLGQSF